MYKELDDEVNATNILTEFRLDPETAKLYVEEISNDICTSTANLSKPI